MNLKEHFVPAAGNSSAISGERRGIPGSHIKIVDPILHRHRNRLFCFCLTQCAKGAVAKADDTDLFVPMGQFSIFH